MMYDHIIILLTAVVFCYCCGESYAFFLVPSVVLPQKSRNSISTVSTQSQPSSEEEECLHQLHKEQHQHDKVAKKEEGGECLLIPETNPNFDPNTTSLSGVPYSLVIRGIDSLYPPMQLSQRNAKSRTDGYWKFIKRGESPPQEFTYGEFEIDFFGHLLDRAWEHYNIEGIMDRNDDDVVNDKSSTQKQLPWNNKTFIDIGSGAGRLVLAAAALHPLLKLAKGLEILQGMHRLSSSIADRCRIICESDQDRVQYVLPIPNSTTSDDNIIENCTASSEYMPLAPIQFTCGSFTNSYEYMGNVDCAFVFSSCMKSNLVKELSCAIGRQCKPGTIIITTEFPLFLKGNIDPLEADPSMPSGEYEIQLLEKINGFCWLMGGTSTAYIHRVQKSLSKEYGEGPRNTPQLSLEEEAYRLIVQMESGELTDTDEFIRSVRNEALFNGVSQNLIPEADS